jgi:hypothetical protein
MLLRERTPTTAAPPALDAETLIKEARQRQRRRRGTLAGIVTAAAAIGLFAVLGPGRPDNSRHARAQGGAGVVAETPNDVFAQDPFMGVSCGIPNSIACNRVGLTVWLRHPAISVSATIAGAPLKLDNREWSGPSRQGRRTRFAGFLQPAGITGRLHVKPDPGSPTTWGANTRVIAAIPSPPMVRFRINYGQRRTVVTQTSVFLHQGWG